MGSGSTGVAAILNNRKFIGIELNKKYFEIDLNRLGLKRKNTLENQLLTKIFMNKFLSKRLFFNFITKSFMMKNITKIITLFNRHVNLN
jgi:hypothetical protein